jgi:hypothetical protein
MPGGIIDREIAGLWRNGCFSQGRRGSTMRGLKDILTRSRRLLIPSKCWSTTAVRSRGVSGRVMGCQDARAKGLQGRPYRGRSRLRQRA